MCGIAGVVNLKGEPIPGLGSMLREQGRLLAHRGPDGEGTWAASDGEVGLAHRRLSIIDLSDAAGQPMHGDSGTVIVFNGAVYNYRDLRDTFEDQWSFRTNSDTETILAAYGADDIECTKHLLGMFAFALWDEKKHRLFCARDHFGVKPFYYAVNGDLFAFASEAKALIPFLPKIETDGDGLGEYLTFQYAIGEKTLFKGIRQLLPGHTLTVEDGAVRTRQYWDVQYEVDPGLGEGEIRETLKQILGESISLNLVSDVEVGAYLSGGIDSTLIGVLASRHENGPGQFFHGKFSQYPACDESDFARDAAESIGGRLHEIDITAEDFQNHIADVIHHLDFPVAGPGAFAQFMASKLAASHVKAVIGGQGGDELFGGYARYLLAYFEQCINAAIEGTYRDGRFVVTPESIIPNLSVLREYKPMVQEFWRSGMFGPMDERYLRLIDRTTDVDDEIEWSVIDRPKIVEAFGKIFNNPANVGRDAYLDKMMHFDFKCLLPALLHVEDRMSMAFGLESRVPFLDPRLVEFLARVPALVKYEGGVAKRLLRETYASVLPESVAQRRDKMGFPIPLHDWVNGELKTMVNDILRSQKALERPYVQAKSLVKGLDGGKPFSRKIWGLLSLELWHQGFHDQPGAYRFAETDAR